ncbi:MAG: peptide deformylase [Lentisphaerae bacterium]|nr:peptide deformylase [Lentisphaerota bacterium]
MKQTIVIFGNSVLRAKAKPVTKVDEKIRQLARDMLDTMYASEGIGLAAEQIARTERMCVIDVTGMKPRPGRAEEPAPTVPMPVVMLNPTITAMEGEQTGPEGCLSFPDVFVNIRRAMKVQVSYMDLDEQVCTAEASGLFARAIQHELDHLDGVLLVDRMSVAQKMAVAGKLKRLKSQATD